MKAADPKIIEILNDVLTAELTAINQYFVHAEMCGNWGYKKLHDAIKKQAIDEMKHAEQLIERILYVEGHPNVQRLGNVQIGQSVHEQLKVDHALEVHAVPRLAEGIAFCNSVSDHGTRILLEGILASEEEHIDWLEAQLDLVEQVGIQNYMAAQISDE
ncbi:MAG: bacterioferritin [Deltaproteobacteria bacterium]|nr:bacterioferritin [Deltaproteobacteria bacterium]